MIDEVNPHHTVIFKSCNGVVGVDKSSEYEMDFVDPQHVWQLIVNFRHLLKRSPRKCAPLHKIAIYLFMLTLDFVRIASEHTS